MQGDNPRCVLKFLVLFLYHVKLSQLICLDGLIHLGAFVSELVAPGIECPDIGIYVLLPAELGVILLGKELLHFFNFSSQLFGLFLILPFKLSFDEVKGLLGYLVSKVGNCFGYHETYLLF